MRHTPDLSAVLKRRQFIDNTNLTTLDPRLALEGSREDYVFALLEAVQTAPPEAGVSATQKLLRQLTIEWRGHRVAQAGRRAVGGSGGAGNVESAVDIGAGAGDSSGVPVVAVGGSGNGVVARVSTGRDNPTTHSFNSASPPTPVAVARGGRTLTHRLHAPGRWGQRAVPVARGFNTIDWSDIICKDSHLPAPLEAG
jgi:hypothetical protein